MTREPQAVLIEYTVHRVLAQHRPYEMCDECRALRAMLVLIIDDGVVSP